MTTWFRQAEPIGISLYVIQFKVQKNCQVSYSEIKAPLESLA